MRYLMVLCAGARRTSSSTFACETAFVQHLRDLRDALAPRFDEIVVAMAELSEADYERQRSYLSEIDEERERIRFRPLFPLDADRKTFLRTLPRTLARLRAEVRAADFVHSHLSFDLWRPVELAASVFAKMHEKRALAVTDLDTRGSAEMNLKLGRWSRRT
jgi:hypothetical protein